MNEKDLNELTLAIYKWFDDRNLFDPIMQFAKLNEEVGEIAHELTRDRRNSLQLKDALGDTYITLVGMAHHLNMDLSECVEGAYNEIKDRKGKTVKGTFIKDTNKLTGTPTEKFYQSACLTLKKQEKAMTVLKTIKENFEKNGAIIFGDLDKETTDYLLLNGLWDF